MKNKISKIALIRGAAALAALSACSVADAHMGSNHVHGFGDGFSHPFTGLDHLAAMLAVGMWAAQRGGRSMWALPASFVGMLAIGAGLALGGVSVPMVEPGIVASVLVLGLMIAFAARLPSAISVAVVGVFALFHGYAHGLEMPESALGLMFGAGFVSASVMLHVAGIGLAGMVAKHLHPKLIQAAGGVIAAAGVYLSFA